MFGVLPGLIGIVQATEAIKWLLGLGDALAGRLLVYDALAMRMREAAPRPRPGLSGLRRRLIRTGGACRRRRRGG